jgi:hypothetical protein
VSREPSELRAELRLVWPADLFAQEAQYLLDTRRLDDETLGWLVEEAFHGPGGRRWLSQIPYPSSPTLAAEGLAAVMAAAAAPAARSRLLADLLKSLETIPPYERLQLWSERHRRSPGPGPFDQPPRPEDRQEDLRTDIAFVLNDLDVHGYFALEFSTTATGSCQDSDGAHWLGEQLRIDPHDPDSPPLWPLFDQYGFAARWWGDVQPRAALRRHRGAALGGGAPSPPPGARERRAHLLGSRSRARPGSVPVAHQRGPRPT